MKLKPIIAAISVALLSTAAQAAQRYAVTVIDNAGSYDSGPSDINNSGQAVGLHDAGTGPNVPYQGYIYSGGVTTPIAAASHTSAQGINDSGQVVGTYSSGGYWSPSYAYLYSDGSMTNIGTLGGTYNTASAINASGQIVGSANTSDNPVAQAYLYSDGNMTLLDPLGSTYSTANDINDSGQIVGQWSYDGYSERAFLYDDGGITDLGTLGGTSSYASAINADGQIVGWSKTADSATHAFIYSDGTMTDLDTPGWSIASGINDSGEIVGRFENGTDPNGHAFLYTDGITTDLNSLIDPLPNLVITDAIDINNSGQIIATGYTPGYGTRSLLLTPVPVPEPATYAMLLAGLGLVGGQAWRRRTSAAKKVEA